jgi:hypothetical protein
MIKVDKASGSGIIGSSWNKFKGLFSFTKDTKYAEFE